MSGDLDMHVLELMTARLCHELAGPLSAVVNGVELMGDDDPDFVADAIKLVGASARTASRRLQFYRFAYGSLPGDGTAASVGRDLAMKYFEGGNVTCDWPLGEPRPFPWQRLACLLVILGAEALPRGGRVSLTGDARHVTMIADGDMVRLIPEAHAGLQPEVAIDHMTARGVHAYLCQRFAAELGLKIGSVTAEPRRLKIEIEPG